MVYLTITRLHIAFAVHVVSQFVVRPTHLHRVAVLRILRYLQGSSNRALLLSSSQNLTLHGYSDSDWAGDVDDRRSTTYFSIFLGSSLISWNSKK